MIYRRAFGSVVIKNHIEGMELAINHRGCLIYNALIYQGMPKISLPTLRIVYVNEMWPAGSDRTFPHEPTLRALAPTLNGLVCLDIEHWPWYKASEEVRAETISKLIQVIDIIKSVNPNVDLGFYSIMPQRNYWVPIKGYPEQVAAWEADNRALQPVADRVDAVFPSLYTFYDAPLDWEKYAAGNLAEARKYGKPVYPLIWPQFHDSMPLKGQHIGGDFWRLQLEVCRAQADGIVLWGGYRTPWDDGHPWWSETAKFCLQQ